MKIAFYVGTFPALSETFVLNQITGLIDRGHDVRIFSARPAPGGKVHPDVERYGLLARTSYWPTTKETLQGLGAGLAPKQTLKMLGRGLKTGGPSSLSWSYDRLGRALITRTAGDFDVILCHFGHLGREAQFLRDVGALTGKLVTFFHGYDMSVFLGERGDAVYGHLFEKGDLFLPISDHWRKKLVGLGAPPSRTRIHRMGIDCTRFEFKERRPGEDGLVHLVTIGRLTEKKGIAYAIEAVAELIETHPNIRYHIAGDGELREELEALVDAVGARDVVTFHGWMNGDEMVAFLEGGHILVTPSVTAANGDTEGIPVVLMEGMAMGLPVVSTYHSGIPELVAHERSGFLVPERDPQALSASLATLVDDPACWRRFGREGRRIVEEEFEIEKLNDRLVAMVESL